MKRPVKSTSARMKLAIGPAATIAARLRSGWPGQRPRAICRESVAERRRVRRARRVRRRRGISRIRRAGNSARRQRVPEPIDPGEQFGAKAERKGLDLHPAPAADEVMAELVKEHDRAHDRDEGQDIPTHPVDPADDLFNTDVAPSWPSAKYPPQPVEMVTISLQWRKSGATPRGRTPDLAPHSESPSPRRRRRACGFRPPRASVRAYARRGRQAPPKAILPSRNAATAISLAAFSAVGAPSPFGSAPRSRSRSAGKRARSAGSNVSPPSAAKIGRGDSRGDPVGIGEAMRDRRSHVRRGEPANVEPSANEIRPCTIDCGMHDDGKPLGRDH